MVEEDDYDEQQANEFADNENALDKEVEDFRLWYNAQYYLYQDPKKYREALFIEELERRQRRIKELEFKTDVYYYKEMMAIMTPEFLEDMWK
jgi:hypothetical protein